MMATHTNNDAPNILHYVTAGSVGAEIGVWMGNTSQKFADKNPKELHLVDAYSVEPYKENTEMTYQDYISKYQRITNEFSEAGTFFASVVGYQNLGPIKYNCKALNKNKAVISENNNSTIKTQFMEMTSCNRKFLQLVLSEGGLLDSSIDGNWNNKMEEAIMNFMKRPELKGFPPSDLFQALEEESICD